MFGLGMDPIGSSEVMVIGATALLGMDTPPTDTTTLGPAGMVCCGVTGIRSLDSVKVTVVGENALLVLIVVGVV